MDADDADGRVGSCRCERQRRRGRDRSLVRARRSVSPGPTRRGISETDERARAPSGGGRSKGRAARPGAVARLSAAQSTFNAHLRRAARAGQNAAPCRAKPRAPLQTDWTARGGRKMAVRRAARGAPGCRPFEQNRGKLARAPPRAPGRQRVARCSWCEGLLSSRRRAGPVEERGARCSRGGAAEVDAPCASSARPQAWWQPS